MHVGVEDNASSSAYVSIRQHMSAYVSIRQIPISRASKSELESSCDSSDIRLHPHTSASAYVSIERIRELESSCDSSDIRLHPHASASAYVSIGRIRENRKALLLVVPEERLVVHLRFRERVAHLHTSAYVSICQHSSAYISICQHTSAFVSIGEHTCA